MKDLKHTPAPWKIQENEIVPKMGAIETELRIVDRMGIVATIYKFAGKNQPENHRIEAVANAKIIASAPELLEACIEALNTLRYMTTDQYLRGEDKPVRDKLKNAIKKATE